MSQHKMSQHKISQHKTTTLNWLKQEFHRLLPVVLFFFVAFTLVDVTAMFMRKQALATVSGFLVISLSALLMGKVVLISDQLPFIDLFSNRPLIYGTVWKSFIYTTCSCFVRLLDHIIPFYIDERNWLLALKQLIEVCERPQFWLAQIWLAVLFFLFVGWRELVMAIGEQKVRTLFFGNSK